MVTTSVVVDCVIYGAVGISGGVVDDGGAVDDGGVVGGGVMMLSGGQVEPLA